MLNQIIEYKKLYYDFVVPEVKKELNFKNNLQVPIIKKVILSIGAGKFFKDNSKMESILQALSYIAGQKAYYTKAKKSVSTFEVRAGMKTGICVTLRGNKMCDFLDRLKYISLPRLRDFKGFKSTSFNGKSFSFGISDSGKLFMEIVEIMDRYDLNFGMNINIVFNINNVSAQKLVLEKLNFPFYK